MRKNLWILALTVLPLPALGQSPPKALILADWERGRKNVLAYVDAMPDSALTYRPTPGVRNFAEQIEHIVGSNIEVAALTLKGAKQAPVLGDTAKYLHHKKALHDFTAATYDYVIAAIKGASDQALAKQMSIFKQPAQPAWRWLELSNEHSAWTLGQVIPYLRLNKVTPPSYDMPF